MTNLISEILNKPRPKLRIPYYPVYAASVACDKICWMIRVNPPLYPRRVEFFSKNRAFSIEKAKRILGYVPEVGLAEGLGNTASWYKEKGLI